MYLENSITEAHHPVAFQDSLRQKLFQAVSGIHVQRKVNELLDCSLREVCSSGIDGKNLADKFRDCPSLENLELRMREVRHYVFVAQCPVNREPHTLPHKAAYLVREPHNLCSTRAVLEEGFCPAAAGPYVAHISNRAFNVSRHERG